MLIDRCVGAVHIAVMPKGVEHIPVVGSRLTEPAVHIAVMPKGVEHEAVKRLARAKSLCRSQ